MTGFREVAAGGAGGPEIVLAGDLADEPRVELAMKHWDEVYDADDVTAEGTFPEFGRFVEVRRWNGGSYDEEAVWWELPSGLAMLIEAEVEEAGGYEEVGPERVTVDIDFAGKGSDGWRFTGDVTVRDS